MPFAGYRDFDDCVAQNQDKDDPAAYCAVIQQEAEKEEPTEDTGKSTSADEPRVNKKNMVERKEVTLHDVKMDEAKGIFEGYASVFNVKDLQNDVVKPGAFRKTIADNNGVFVLLDQHDTEKEIGLVRAEEDETGLRIKGQFYIDPNGDPQRELRLARETYVKMMRRQEAGKPLQFSIGYRAINPRFEKGTRVLEEIGLAEVSTVTFPALPQATATMVKSEKRFDLKSFDAMYREAIAKRYPVMAVDVAIGHLWHVIEEAMMSDVDEVESAMMQLEQDLSDFSAAVYDSVFMYHTGMGESEEDVEGSLTSRVDQANVRIAGNTEVDEPLEEHSDTEAVADGGKAELVAHLAELKNALTREASSPSVLTERIREKMREYRESANREISNG